MYRRNSLESVRIISRSIRADESEISQSEANDMRKDYLKIMDNKSLSFEERTQKITDNIIFPVYLSLHLKPKEHRFRFDIVNKKKDKVTTNIITSSVIYLGRNEENHIVLSNDRNISRIQSFMFVAANKIVILDIWSICGTSTIQRSNHNKKLFSTLPNNRSILLFDKKEIIHINAAQRIDILITPQHANKKDLKQFNIYKYITDNDDTKNDDDDDDDILNKKQKEFKHWLCHELGLSQYYDAFINKGFDEIEVVAMMKESDLKELGIDKKGHRWKILLYLKKQTNDDNDNEEGVTKEGDDHTTSQK